MVPLCYFSLTDDWQYCPTRFNAMAAAYMRIIDATGRLNLFCPVMISMADIDTVGAFNDEDKCRFGNTIRNLREF